VIDFNTLAQQCAPTVHPTTLSAVVRTESGFNPYAIGVVGGHLVRQPRTLEEAVATAKALDAHHINFSMGLGQVNKSNLTKYGLTYDTVFDVCKNLSAGSQILADCYRRASALNGPGGPALQAAISCYYSGNFTTGLKRDFGGTSYVQRVAANTMPSIDYVPAIRAVMDRATTAKSARPTPPAKPRAVPAAKESPAAAPTVREETTQKDGGWDAFGDFSK
jgi:type IV secretion system protein VirB1